LGELSHEHLAIATVHVPNPTGTSWCRRPALLTTSGCQCKRTFHHAMLAPAAAFAAVQTGMLQHCEGAACSCRLGPATPRLCSYPRSCQRISSNWCRESAESSSERHNAARSCWLPAACRCHTAACQHIWGGGVVQHAAPRASVPPLNALAAHLSSSIIAGAAMPSPNLSGYLHPTTPICLLYLMT